MGSASASRGDTTIGTAQTDQTDKKEGHVDTKRHTQQANKQDYWDDLGSTQQTDTWVATDNYPPILQPIRPARFLAFLIVFFFLIFFFLSVSFVVLPFSLLLLIEIYVIFYVSLRTKRTLAHSCWR